MSEVGDTIEVPRIRNSSIQQGLAVIAKEGNRGQQFEIDPSKNPITVDDLQSVLKQPWEYSLHEDSGKLIFAVGTEKNPQNDKQLMVPNNTALFLHTHRTDSKNTFLSMSDVFTTRKYGLRAQLILVTTDGIVVFKRPTYDPVRERPTNESPRELMASWGEQEKVDFYSGETKDGIKNFFMLPLTEQISIARKFCADTHMIVEEINWNDLVSIERVLRAINLRETISDNTMPHIPSVMDDIGVSIDELPISGPQRGSLDAIIDHLNGVNLRRGRLFRDKEMRESYIKFALQLIDELRAGGLCNSINRA